MAAEPGIRRPASSHAQYAGRPMVEWFHPYRLLVTGLQVLVWEFVGQGRPMEESARSHAVVPFHQDDDIWFDYVADVGDGWRPTFTIASLLAQQDLEVNGEVLPRGRFLVLGGDEVYPTPGLREYRQRFAAPYEAALPREAPRVDVPPALFAIPGNHDWYDGLVAFSREFTQHRQIGRWQTVQDQSYFAIQLPHRWWLWGLDVTSGQHMDHGQREFFGHAATLLHPGDRVILAGAVPDWIDGPIEKKEDSHFWTVQHDLITTRQATVHLWLAGDAHHYRRHEGRGADGKPKPQFQRITSGGGGAYLSPTHRPGARTVVVGTDEFTRKTTFPSRVTSFRLSFMNLAFALKNWKLGIFPFGIVYWLLTWVHLPNDVFSLNAWIGALGTPGTVLWLVVVLTAFVVFADPTRRWFRWIGGVTHGLAHIAVAGIATGLVNQAFLTDPGPPTDMIAASLLNFLAGALLGPTVFGIYLLLSVNLFGLQSDAAFSSLRIEDYKHFLRLHVCGDGVLEIFPIAVRKVPRQEGRARYGLVEAKIVIDPASARQHQPAAPDPPTESGPTATPRGAETHRARHPSR